MGQRWRLVGGVLVSLFFLAWAARLVGSFGPVLVSLGQANYLLLLPALLAYFAGVGLRAVRWHFLLRPVKSIPSRRLFPVVVIGYMANDVLPARLGELVRAYVLGEQENVAKTTTVGTIVVERLFDGMAMLIFVGVVGLTVPLNAEIANVFRAAALLFVVALSVLFVVGSSRSRAVGLAERIEGALPTAVQGRAAHLIDRFLQGLDCLQSGRLSSVVLLLSLGAWLCEATMYLLIGIGFGLSLSFLAYVLTAAVANLGAMVPAAPGYVGTFDFFALASLALFNPNRGQVAGYVLVLHVALLVPVTLLGFYYLWRSNLSLRSLGQRVAVAPEKAP